MADEDSPVGSPLSDLSSEAFEGDDQETLTMPPAKRQRLGASIHAIPIQTSFDDDADISSDTSGDIPNSPLEKPQRPEDDETHEQVTVCSWTGCDAGDLGNMDALVEHIHNEHIETRQKKYTCEWSDCLRRSMPHASGYALKAHMRSHTREKPFYCALPECDRAFTRSDALAKHMRTVHETEALRPSDPIPKSMQPLSKSARLKINLKHQQEQTGDLHMANGETNGNDPPGWTSSYPTELGFTAEEEERGPKELWRLLRRQVHWAEEEGALMKRHCEDIEERRKKEWLEKEILLDQVIQTEMSWHERRQEVLKSLETAPIASDINTVAAAIPPVTATSLDVANGVEDAAAVLASMHQS